MNPFESARSLHRSLPDVTPFEEALTAHLLLGVVISTPAVFVMARPVDSGADHFSFDDPWISYPDPDTWHIYLAAGDLSLIDGLLPYSLPLVSFVRKNRLRFRNLKHMHSLLSHGGKSKSSGGATAEECGNDAGAERSTE